MTIAIASGKGGTGKTTFSVNLSVLLSAKENITLIDLDVEEPNCNNYLNIVFSEEKQISKSFPFINQSKCNACGLCQKVCQFNAIVILPKSSILFKELCHSCGRCAQNCPKNAISESPFAIGTLSKGKRDNTLSFYQGTLKEGLSQTASLIKIIKKELLPNQYSQKIILDCPPGTTCPMVESISGSDFLILVTEPNIFGLHDLKDAINAASKLHIPFAVVINKASSNNPIIEEFCFQKNIKILGKIPFSQEAAYLSSSGQFLIREKTYKDEFEKIIKNLEDSLCTKS